jgi:hypothetical protein
VSAQLPALRALLELRFPDAAPLVQRTTRPVSCGVAALDAAFPGGGLARGKLTAWVPGGGAVAVLRSACRATIAAGERAAWIDAAGTVGPDWPEGPLLIWPADPMRRINALRCAELLLSSGGFALVVLTGSAPEGTESVRLVRAAREGGGAIVVLTHNPTQAALRVSSRLFPHGYRWRPGPFDERAAPIDATVELRTRSLGWNRSARAVLPVTPYELRLSLDLTLAERAPDRRGADRRERSELAVPPGSRSAARVGERDTERRRNGRRRRGR